MEPFTRRDNHKIVERHFRPDLMFNLNEINNSIKREPTFECDDNHPGFIKSFTEVYYCEEELIIKDEHDLSDDEMLQMSPDDNDTMPNTNTIQSEKSNEIIQNIIDSTTIKLPIQIGSIIPINSNTIKPNKPPTETVSSPPLSPSKDINLKEKQSNSINLLCDEQMPPNISTKIAYQTLKLRHESIDRTYKIPMTENCHQDSLESILNDLSKSIARDEKRQKHLKEFELKLTQSTNKKEDEEEEEEKKEGKKHKNRLEEFICRITYDCRICSESFALSTIRYKHEQDVHKDPKTSKYKCTICNEQHKSIISLQGHIGRHTGFVCDVCGQVYASRVYLKMHQLTHNDIKSHRCQICSKMFRDKYKLNRHLLRHSGQRPFKCNSCDKTYKDYTDLKRHKYTHGGYTPRFVCSYCGKRFYENRNLQKHTKIHLKMIKVEPKIDAVLVDGIIYATK